MHAIPTALAPELDLGGLVTHGEEWGGQIVRHLTLPAGTDFRPLFVGLPGDACQCPHWGIVESGSITVRYADGREETTSAGEVYHWPAGHTGWTDEGVVFLEWSPADALRPVLDHVGRQLPVAGS